MTRHRLTPLLLIASLLFGLWAAAMHDSAHAGVGSHVETCVVCAFAGAAGAGLASSALALLFAACTLPFLRAVQTAPGVASRAPIRVRGPPSLLA